MFTARSPPLQPSNDSPSTLPTSKKISALCRGRPKAETLLYDNLLHDALHDPFRFLPDQCRPRLESGERAGITSGDDAWGVPAPSVSPSALPGSAYTRDENRSRSKLAYPMRSAALGITVKIPDAVGSHVQSFRTLMPFLHTAPGMVVLGGLFVGCNAAAAPGLDGRASSPVHPIR
jgi:hypothetical protein